MTIDAGNTPVSTSTPANQNVARTDDLLASGAERHDGARGFDGKSDPGALRTGMEGIADATASDNNKQTDGNKNIPSETVQDNPGQVRNKPSERD